jgi:multicomponent Na+:H+ antiporter subunit D
MDFGYWMPILVLLTSLATAVTIFTLREEQVRLRTTLNVAGASVMLLLVWIIVWANMRGVHFEARLAFLPGLDLVLQADFLALLFGTLSAVLWLATTIYAVGYLEASEHRSRFFGFFSLCVMATMGIAFAGNLLTFVLFYELLTVVTFPLIMHRGSRAAAAAGRVYLVYTLSGGLLLLAGAAWLHVLAGSADFATGGYVAGAGASRGSLVAVFALMVTGLAVKAAIVPLHGWLPVAMVAPAPVSALLHAVAVVKAGAFGIIRVVYDVFGVRTADDIGVLTPLAVAAAVTIIWGSLRALMQDDLKRRLAYSTVSQLSYITLGVATFGPISTVGGLAHLIHQGIMKVTLFFCAGLLAETLSVKRVSEMAGVGRRMPLTMAAFTTAAFGMIGVPPLAGFVSKWHLGLGGIEAGDTWIVAVLIASTFLNAAYFLPIVRTAWFDAPRDAWWHERLDARGPEASWWLLGPALATAVLAVGAGLLAAVEISPLGLARRAALGVFGE